MKKNDKLNGILLIKQNVLIFFGLIIIAFSKIAYAEITPLNLNSKHTDKISNRQIEQLRDSFIEKPFGYRVTTGAAEGYIDDKACGTCHYQLFESYKQIGMSKSFVPAEPQHYIENFSVQPYFHPLSQRYYEVRRNGDHIYFTRYQLDSSGQKINQYERKIDWIMGSGNKVRSYLYQTEIGEMFQLPIGWYTAKQQWGLSPGYDKKYHQGITRQVPRECLFCHNAFPEVTKGSDMRWQPHIFPKKLPHGTGCQRCHGPGAAHIQTVFKKAPLEEIKNSIVNPARLPTLQRDSVCFQCHMLPAVALIGIRHFDRADYSFRPGESVTDYMVHVDANDPSRPDTQRFEINHHAYRLTKSKCFQQSEGKLTCISCHNPHQKVSQEDRIAHFSPKCLKCHKKHNTEYISYSIPNDDCTTCHMPKTRTQDVVHVVMTDHLIQKNSKTEHERLAPLNERETNIDRLEFLMPEHSPQGAMGEIYKSITLLRATTTANAVDYLKKQLQKVQLDNVLPYFDLAKGEILLKRYNDAEKTINRLFKSYPSHYLLKQWMGIVYFGQEKLIDAEKMFQESIDENPNSPEIYLNLGLLKIKQKKYKTANKVLLQAVELRPNMSKAWYYLAISSIELEKNQEAIEQFKQALAIDPSNTHAYIKLAQTLKEQGKNSEGIRYLNHGLENALKPKKITDALSNFEGNSL